jgi:hypothetical protein
VAPFGRFDSKKLQVPTGHHLILGSTINPVEKWSFWRMVKSKCMFHENSIHPQNHRSTLDLWRHTTMMLQYTQLINETLKLYQREWSYQTQYGETRPLNIKAFWKSRHRPCHGGL